MLWTTRKSTREAMGGSHVKPYEFKLDSLAAVASRLREVKLQNCGLKKMVRSVPVPATPYFSSLAVVKLEFVSATGWQVQSLLNACGSLWNLVIYCCHQIIRLRVAHARLRLLQVDRKLKSMQIRAPELRRLRYAGHRIAINYAHVPLLCKLELISLKNSPLDCLGTARRLRMLETLSLRFPSPLVATDQLRHDGRLFRGLHTITLYLKNSWGKNIVSMAYLLQAAPFVQTLKLEACGVEQSAPPPPTELKITWPEGCLANMLHKVSIGGFNGEPELVELCMLLLRISPHLKTLVIYTRRGLHRIDKAKKAAEDDVARREHAIGVVLAKLAPAVPSKVKFTAC